MSHTEASGDTGRLWTPWRMNYVGGGTKETGCIFCNRLGRKSDIESLILCRSSNSFAIMNLYPYNTGHIMLVPNQHASDPGELPLETLAEMGVALPSLTAALRRAFGCHGFNVGLNIGAIAGAGVEAHLHQHIVPRWQGDANFMPIIARTMTIPELIPVTYARIRGELTREITGATRARVVFTTPDDTRVLLHEGTVPQFELSGDTPVVQLLLQALPPAVSNVQLAGWAGPDHAGSPQGDDIILSTSGAVEGTLPAGWELSAVSDLGDDRDTPAIVHRALAQRAPAR